MLAGRELLQPGLGLQPMEMDLRTSEAELALNVQDSSSPVDLKEAAFYNLR